MNQLEQLREWTIVVADTGDFEAIRKFQPKESTTNPSLILSASQKEEYRPLIVRAKGKGKGDPDFFMDCLFVEFGLAILQVVPGRVSTEVDARLSFDVAGTIARAKRLIDLYEKASIPRDRILIKLASTWEGFVAAKVLEKEGIHCNMTLLFSLPQARAAADARATLISPFVGRILDWYKAKNPNQSYQGSDDPGVISVKEIYTYYKSRGYPTQIMGASFRNKEEITELAGLDLLTISPQLLQELERSKDPLTRKLTPKEITPLAKEPLLEERQFRYELNENAMATEKLAEGIRKFSEDYVKLQKQLLST